VHNIFVNNVINNLDINMFILFSSFIFLTGFTLSKFYLSSLFGICYSNEKTSIEHPPMLRGLGIWYLFAISPFFFFYNECFKLSEWFLIYGAVIVGFWDDKRGLSQKKKLVVLFVLWFFSECIFLNENLGVSSFFITDAVLRFSLFMFFILFFNQVDGINGLAGLTYLVFILSLLSIFILSSVFINFYLACLLITIMYLIINLYGKIGIQGESGSFFMGVTSYVLIINSFDDFYALYSIFLICPILLDLVITSIYLYLQGHDLFKGHRENIYQKLTSKFESHAKISSVFALLQIIFSFYMIYFWNNGLAFDKIILLMLLCVMCSFFLYTIRLKINQSEK
jgi:UDP-N-acetylmuramyl pentapeptide phosphotransferase/UDP-N-acetylglucosamine-1-phosphate transferase